MSERLTPEREAEIAAIAERAAADPFFVSDCEGELQVWREKALTHVRRDESGEIEMYSFPSTYRVTDQIIEIDLDTWDPGEDASDDQRREDITDLVQSRTALTDLLAELAAVRAERDEARERMATVETFVADRASYITAIRNCHPDNGHDYDRWQGHAESRRQLAERLGLPVAWPAENTEAAR